MADAAQIKITEVSAREESFAADFSNISASVRVAPNSYFIAVFLATFFTAFFVYLEQDFVAVLLFVTGAIVLPLLALTDRIVFDGAQLTRTGIVPRLWKWINREPQILKLADIEQVETQALRALKRGGSVFYRYKTSVAGKNSTFVFASGSEDYRRMARRLFSVLSVDALDNRSLELRDYLHEPKEISIKARFSQIPSTEVLESSVNEFQNADRNLRSKANTAKIGDEQIGKAEDLRRLANELRLAGNLLQSLEAFRRALRLNPLDAWLIFEFARCLHSYASSERSEKLQKKARAALRLAELRAGGDGELLSRLGESYFQYGDRTRARAAFQKALAATTGNFRSVRGLAEIALRDGKIAHVIHHFTTAIHFARTNALRRWAQTETAYFSRLNTDENYLEAEIKRMNRLDNFEGGKKLSLKIAVAAFFVILMGISFDERLANVGWACACVSLLIWAGLIMSRNLLAERNSPASEEN